MTERERLAELHLALDGAVDQLAAAHRLAVAGAPPKDGGAEGPVSGFEEYGQRSPWTERVERLLGDAVALRNEVRDHLLNKLARPL